jgi:hypothetical protein
MRMRVFLRRVAWRECVTTRPARLGTPCVVAGPRHGQVPLWSALVVSLGGQRWSHPGREHMIRSHPYAAVRVDFCAAKTSVTPVPAGACQMSGSSSFFVIASRTWRPLACPVTAIRSRAASPEGIWLNAMDDSHPVNTYSRRASGIETIKSISAGNQPFRTSERDPITSGAPKSARPQIAGPTSSGSGSMLSLLTVAQWMETWPTTIAPRRIRDWRLMTSNGVALSNDSDRPHSGGAGSLTEVYPCASRALDCTGWPCSRAPHPRRGAQR